MVIWTGRVNSALAAVLMLGMAAVPGFALQPPKKETALQQREFFEPDLVIPSSNRSLHRLLPQLDAGAWDGFFARHGSDFHVYVDPRSGVPTNIMGPIPFIPGSGVGNDLQVSDLSRRLARPVTTVDPAVVGELLQLFLIENRGVFNIDVAELGEPHAARVSEHLWHFAVPRQVDGVPVRESRIAGAINNGNIVLIGAETWGRVDVSPVPTLSLADAESIVSSFMGGRRAEDIYWREPRLELIPYSTAEVVASDAVGQGYGYRLAWVISVRRPPAHPSWEALVDAQSGRLLAFQDENHYATEQVSGGVYPLTSTEICQIPEQCGTMQDDYPMPFASTGLPAPDDVTNSAGLFNYSSGTVTVDLSGPYVRISDSCGAVNETGIGSIDLGGANGQHDCTTPTSGGNTAASRSGFYELNKLIEMARGWLPNNSWLRSPITANMNITQTCNAFYSFGSINFYQSGGGCRNTGEIAAVFDHEWGHALDDNDSGGGLSNSSEGYADIVGIYRLHASCVGHGFFETTNFGCGMTADGTGFNQNEAQVGGAHCDTDCSGVRDADWAKHADNTPDTPQNFVCPSCSTSSGPCGRQVHCAAAPVRQAAWDLVTRDLTAPPFNYDANTAFIVGNRVFYQGSGNVGTWHACNCTAGTSDGCGATHGYLQWLAADDDDGNLNNGTPHMTAIFAAFDRHNIACSTPAPVDSGCSGGPTAATTLSVSPGNNAADLTWTPVTGATRYWVFRTEGHAGCDLGKALIAEVTGTTYSDTEVANGRQYCYTVLPAGANDACFGPASNCECVSPVAGPSARYLSGSAVQTADTGDDDGYPDNCETVSVDFQVVNDGSVALTNVAVDSLTSTHPGVAVTTSTPIGLGSLGIGATATGSFQYQLQNATCSQDLDFLISVTADQMSGSNPGGFGFTAEVDVTNIPQLSFGFESDLEGWTVVQGTMARTTAYGGAEGSWGIASSSGQALQCDQIRSPMLGEVTASSTLTLATHYDIMPSFFGFWYNRANVAALVGGNRAVLPISGGRGYQASGGFGACGMDADPGYADANPSWADSTFDISALAGQDLQLDVLFGTTFFAPGTGFRFDDVRVTNLIAPTCDTQPDVCTFCPTITLSPAALPDGVEGLAYAQTISAAGGVAPYTYVLTSGSLPPGLALNGGTGEVSGIPTAAGTYPFEVEAVDANGCSSAPSGRIAYSITVAPAVDYILGEGLGGSNTNRVRVYTRDGVPSPVDFQAYGAGGWGTNVEPGLLMGGPYAEILSGPGPGPIYGPQVRAFDRSGQPVSKVSFFAYGTLRFGVNVGAADSDDDGWDEIASGAGPGAVFGPHVRGWNVDGGSLTPIQSINFFAYGSLRYGVNVGSGDVDADRFGELLTGPGPGSVFGPQVRGWDADGGAVTGINGINFNAFSLSSFGVNVAGGDIDADGWSEIVAAPGPGPSHASMFSGFDFDGGPLSPAPGYAFTSFAGTLYGGRVGLGDLTGDGRWELAVGAGRDPAATSAVEGYAYDGTAQAPLPNSGFVPFGSSTYGVNPAAGALGHF